MEYWIKNYIDSMLRLRVPSSYVPYDMRRVLQIYFPFRKKNASSFNFSI